MRNLLLMLLCCLCASGCGEDPAGPQAAGLADAGGGADAGADEDRPDGGVPDEDSGPEDTGDQAPVNDIVVTADWLNHTLTVFDYGRLVSGGQVSDAIEKTVDLTAFEAGPLQVEIVPGGAEALVSLGPGFFDGALGALAGASEVPAGGGLLIVDLEGGVVLAEIDTAHTPMGLAVSPDGTRGYSANFGESGSRGRTISVVDIPGRRLLEDVAVGSGPEQVSLSADGTLGIVNLAGAGGVRVFRSDDVSGSLSPVLETGSDPSDVAFIDGNRTAIAVNSQSIDAVLIDVSDPSAPSVLATVSLSGGFPYSADHVPGTETVLMAFTGATTSLQAFSTKDDAFESLEVYELEGGGFPLNAAVDSAGRFAFVPHPSDRKLSVLNLDSGSLTTVEWLDSGAGPTYVDVE